jgi:hypothetical protein
MIASNLLLEQPMRLNQMPNVRERPSSAGLTHTETKVFSKDRGTSTLFLRTYWIWLLELPTSRRG